MLRVVARGSVGLARIPHGVVHGSSAAAVMAIVVATILVAVVAVVYALVFDIREVRFQQQWGEGAYFVTCCYAPKET